MVYLPTGSSDLINFFDPQLLACEQALRVALAVGGKMKESLQLCLRNLNSTSNSPVAPLRLSCQISANQREAEMSTNVNKHWKHVPRVMTSLLMSFPPISISHRLFWCGYSNSRDIVAISSLSCPAARASWRACLQATQLHDLQPSCSWASPLCVLVL